VSNPTSNQAAFPAQGGKGRAFAVASARKKKEEGGVSTGAPSPPSGIQSTQGKEGLQAVVVLSERRKDGKRRLRGSSVLRGITELIRPSRGRVLQNQAGSETTRGGLRGREKKEPF